MIYIENIFVCIAIPMLLSLFFTEHRQRVFTLFVVAGMASSTVSGGYSSVLLHSGASAYVVVGIAAFVTGCIVTALCLYLKKRRSKRD